MAKKKSLSCLEKTYSRRKPGGGGRGPLKLQKRFHGKDEPHRKEGEKRTARVSNLRMKRQKRGAKKRSWPRRKACSSWKAAGGYKKG